MTRHELRVRVFQLLFRSLFHEQEDMPQQAVMFFEAEENEQTNLADKEYIQSKLNNVLEKIEEIDEIIQTNMTGWTMERIGKVERTILRLAVYEMLFDDDIPLGVAIDEAVELGKVYGQDNAGSFINGVLTNVRKAKLPEA